MTNKNNLPETYKVLADNIPVGKKNSILLDQLMIMSDIRDKRNAYEIIEQLIVQYGYVIGASKSGLHRGYHKPADEVEFNEMSKVLKASVDSLTKRYDSLIENYKAQR